jgi:hypothetical protein
MLAHGLDHQSEHVDFALGVMGGERQDVAAGIVEDAVNAYGLALAVNHERGAVADVCVPQRAGTLGLPTEPHLAARGVSAAKRYAVQALLLVEAAHAARGNGALVESPLGDERAQNHWHRS